ncbi:unnamed protein product [Blepharisma stoltei]|uniref:Uncharacterized protein n=1 Tax=Blepharisma stoltei TaxID=1481888 RepID=A0AAU9JV52_9CILI|nr:unnamed protein product [Blepharisma stoltei]
MKICLYNNKVAPDLTNNCSGKLRGRGVRQPLILRNYTNQSQGKFISSLRSTPIGFISPPFPRKPKKDISNIENIYSSFSRPSSSYNRAISCRNERGKSHTSSARNGSTSCDRRLSESFEFSHKPKELLSRIRKIGCWTDKSRLKKYEALFL